MSSTLSLTSSPLRLRGAVAVAAGASVDSNANTQSGAETDAYEQHPRSQSSPKRQKLAASGVSRAVSSSPRTSVLSHDPHATPARHAHAHHDGSLDLRPRFPLLLNKTSSNETCTAASGEDEEEREDDMDADNADGNDEMQDDAASSADEVAGPKDATGRSQTRKFLGPIVCGVLDDETGL